MIKHGEVVLVVSKHGVMLKQIREGERTREM
jgi:hypothetical protein